MPIHRVMCTQLQLNCTPDSCVVRKEQRSDNFENPALVAPNFTNQFPKHTPFIYLCSLTDGPVPNSFHRLGQCFCVGKVVVVLKQNEKCLYSTTVSQCLHFSRQWPYKCLNFNTEKWHFTFNYSRIYPHITHIHILIYFLARSLGGRWKCTHLWFST